MSAERGKLCLLAIVIQYDKMNLNEIKHFKGEENLVEILMDRMECSCTYYKVGKERV